MFGIFRDFFCKGYLIFVGKGLRLFISLRIVSIFWYFVGYEGWVGFVLFFLVQRGWGVVRGLFVIRCFIYLLSEVICEDRIVYLCKVVLLFILFFRLKIIFLVIENNFILFF